jgi:hypothetical protein
MKISSRLTPAVFLFRMTMLMACVMLSPVVCAAGHVGDCDAKEGVDKLRCERHMKMAEKCGPLKGDAHFACDREFLLANPLGCNGLKDKAVEACNREVNAFKTCQPNVGREFMICVEKTGGQSPMGH